MQRILSGTHWSNRFLPIALILTGAGVIAMALAADLLDFGGLQGIGPRQAALALSGLRCFPGWSCFDFIGQPALHQRMAAHCVGDDCSCLRR